MDTALAFAGNVISFEQRIYFIPCETLLNIQRLRQDSSALRKSCIAQSQLAEPKCSAGYHARCKIFEHPSDIGRGDEMQRAAHRPGTNDFSACDGALYRIPGPFLCPERHRP